MTESAESSYVLLKYYVRIPLRLLRTLLLPAVPIIHNGRKFVSDEFTQFLTMINLKDKKAALY